MSHTNIYPITLPVQSSLKSYQCYLVQHEGKNLLIDAGVNRNDYWKKFCQTMDALQLRMEALDAIILTHHHADHIGFVNRLRKFHDVPVFAHERAFSRLKRDEQVLKERIAFFDRLYKSMGCGEEATEQITRMHDALVQNKNQAIEGEIIPIEEGVAFGDFSALEVPGHALDHIVLYDEKDGILFGGDMVIAHSSTNALIDIGKDGNRSLSLIQYEQSLQRLRELSLQVIYAGHGEVINNPLEVIEQKQSRIRQKGEKIYSFVKGRRTAAHIAQEIYRSKYDSLFPLVMSEVIGHLDRLVYLDKLSVTFDNGVYYYEKI